MKKNFLKIVFIAAAILVAFLVFGSITTSSSTPAACKESMEECCKKKGNGKAENNIWEAVSGQFSTSFN